jgi:Flp pilus assembly protein TadG
MTRFFSRRVITRIRDSRGATLVEAAFITPLLLLLTFGIVDFASLFYVYLALENGVSQATRYAVTGAVVAGMSREESIKAAMRSATPTLTISDAMFTFSHLPPGAPAGAAWSAGSGIENDIGRVTINYPWRLMTPLVSTFFTGGQLTVRVESVMKNERRWN